MGRAKPPLWWLEELPVVPGAACRDYPLPLWDNWLDGETRDARAERHQRAVEVCSRCPAVEACARAQAESGADGVWAGRLVDVDEAVRVS